MADPSGSQPVDAFQAEAIHVVEIDADERISAIVMFDVEDIEAAFAELDARYLAGEAAAHARTWSVISGSYAAINRHELPLTTPDCVNIDHRRETAMGVGDLIAYIGAGPDRDQDNKAYVEAVHRLTDPGAVVTYAAHETSQEGFDAEWRGIAVFTVDGELVNRTEVFDEADLDAAIARFDQLSRPAPRLENAASQVTERFAVHLRARDWDAMAELLADDFCSDDRRGVVGAGIQHGRDAHMADMRTIVDLWITKVSSTIIATRGERLVLMRTHFSGSDQGPGAFLTEVFGLVEIDTDERIVAIVSFDLDEIDAAFDELDARYLAGEAAAHSRTWSLVAAAYACYNRRELPPTTPDWVNVDRRRMTMYAPGDVFKYVRGGWDYISDISFRIEAVHQLSNLGAVVTHTGRGTSQEGFDAEWREIHVMTVEGDLFNRSEMFDEADLDAAIARFEELIRRRRGWKTRQAKWTSAFRRTSPPATGTPWPRYCPPSFSMTIAVGSWARESDMVEDAEIGEHACGVAEIGDQAQYDGHCDTRQRLVLARYAYLAPRPASPTHSASRSSASSRSTPTSGSRRSSCSTPTTSTPPSRSSTPDTSPAKPPPTRTVVGRYRGPSPRSTGTSFRERRRTGSTSTTGEPAASRPVS